MSLDRTLRAPAWLLRIEGPDLNHADPSLSTSPSRAGGALVTQLQEEFAERGLITHGYAAESILDSALPPQRLCHSALLVGEWSAEMTKRVVAQIRAEDEPLARHTLVIRYGGAEEIASVVADLKCGIDEHHAIRRELAPLMARIEVSAGVARVQAPLQRRAEALAALERQQCGTGLIDHRTGLGNRRALIHQLEQLRQRREQEALAVALALLKVDPEESQPDPVERGLAAESERLDPRLVGLGRALTRGLATEGQLFHLGHALFALLSSGNQPQLLGAELVVALQNSVIAQRGSCRLGICRISPASALPSAEQLIRTAAAQLREATPTDPIASIEL